MPRLIILAKNNSVRQINIASAITTIGRAQYAQVRIDSNHVSRHHAVIQWEGSRFVLTDMGSRNGTYVNNTKVSNQPLFNGDSIAVGDCQLRFLFSSSLLLPGEALRLLTMPGDLAQMDARARRNERARRAEHPALLG
ncbi:MAG: FHA domain-containing protein [Gammaproteobacteria bacterium]|nr:FHA domain-containing protein [Gammaproteobacteria bacterium]MBU1443112.1 FHA domain-containing protein [Gammaproteobacteria bacterium]MBU2408404.1 FHA domain-containing protein [Gammaproteobacteria bacterium]